MFGRLFRPGDTSRFARRRQAGMLKIQSLPVHHGRTICAVEVEGDSGFAEITNADTDGPGQSHQQ